MRAERVLIGKLHDRGAVRQLTVPTPVLGEFGELGFECCDFRPKLVFSGAPPVSLGNSASLRAFGFGMLLRVCQVAA